MILLDGHSLSLEQLLAIADDRAEVGSRRGAVARVAPPAPSWMARPPATPRSTASTPASARFAESEDPPRVARRLQLNLLRSHAAGVGEPLPVRAVRAMMALRANVLASGFSGIRARDARGARRAAQSRRASRGPEPRIGRARAATSRRSRTSRSCSSARARRWDGRRRAARRGRAARAPASRRSRSRPRRASRSSTARRPPRPSSPSRSPAPSAWRARPTSWPRCRSTRCAGSLAPVRRRASTPSARYAGQAASAANIAALLDGSAINASHVNCARVQDAYSERCAAAGARLGPRGAALRPRA